MKIVLWIGNEPNQKALANKIHQRFPITAIVTETRKHRRKLTPRILLEKGIEKLFLSRIGNAWFRMLAHYRELYSKYPAVEQLDVGNINDEKVFQFTRQQEPDLIIVSGTRLIKQKLLSLNPAIGILNLHTGLSPYIKGGPNCTNWCIATNQVHLIGNTVMWIDEGIDTGNIMATEFTDLSGDESLLSMHIKVMDHAHDLYVRCIRQVAEGRWNRVPQHEIAEGTTFYNREWGLKQKWRLLKNFSRLKKEIASGQMNNRRKDIKVFPIHF